eukprot:296127-Chlamydomonas_euryale.AAC.1
MTAPCEIRGRQARSETARLLPAQLNYLLRWRAKPHFPTPMPAPCNSLLPCQLSSTLGLTSRARHLNLMPAA